jgi:FtsP/CotA-like multicopper oxidase with cupredoxin domain
VIENIGALAYKADTVPSHCLDEALHEFLAELLHHLRCGLTLFHCHQQLHMDFGFMALFKYA